MTSTSAKKAAPAVGGGSGEAAGQQKVSSSLDEVRELLRRQQSEVAKGGWSDGVVSLPLRPDGSGRRVYRATVALGDDYSPVEVRVRVVTDNNGGASVVVEAEHREERPGQKIRRRFQRCLRPPAGTDLSQLVTSFAEPAIAVAQAGEQKRAPTEAGGVCRQVFLEAPFLGETNTAAISGLRH